MAGGVCVGPTSPPPALRQLNFKFTPRPPLRLCFIPAALLNPSCVHPPLPPSGPKRLCIMHSAHSTTTGTAPHSTPFYFTETGVHHLQ